MSSDSHATITYTLMSSYEVIVNGYFRMPMDPLDPYAQLVLEAPPSPKYIPELEAPPLPDYIPGPEYPEGDDDADDDLLEDDADDEDEEESSDSEEEEEEYLPLTVPAPDLHKVERLLAIPTPPLSLVSPTSYPLPPFLMPLPIFTPLPPPPPPPIILPRTRASMVLMRSVTPSTFILAPLSRIPPIWTPPLLPIPLLTSSFPLPLLLPSTSCREGIPEADMPLRKRTRFTTPTGGYEVGESSIAAAARQIRHALTVDDSRRAEDRLIGRLRRKRRYFFTLSTTYAREVAHSRDY
nr:hypothetical protein [Tanacetum cinerariifolium]